MADTARNERTVTAADIMSSPVITVTDRTTIGEAAHVMLTNGVGSVVVLDENGHFAGILTERMMLPTEAMVPFMRGKAFRLLGIEIGDFENIEETMDEVRSIVVKDIADKKQASVSPETHVAQVVETMVGKDQHHVCVIENRKPVGIVSRHDLLRLFFDQDYPAEVRDALRHES